MYGSEKEGKGEGGGNREEEGVKKERKQKQRTDVLHLVAELFQADSP